MICNKKKSSDTRVLYKKSIRCKFAADRIHAGCWTQKTFQLGSRRHCSLWLDWGIGHKNDCEMRVNKDSVGPWNIDLTIK